MTGFGFIKITTALAAGAVIVGWMAGAVPAAAGDTESRKAMAYTSSNSASAYLRIFPRERETSSDEALGWKAWLSKSLFSSPGEIQKIEKNLRMGMTSANAPGMPYYMREMEERGAYSISRRKVMEDRAREEVYRVASNMVLSLEPVARLRDIVEPLTKPVEVYRSGNGSISSSYFGRAGRKAAEDSVKVFGLTLAVSARHNINLIVDLYERVKVSYVDGRVIEASYSARGGAHRFGFKGEDMDRMYLIYKFGF